MDYMYDLKEKLCDELKEYARKQDMSAGDLEMVHKLTDTIKNIDKISMLEEEGGYSQAGNWEADMRGSYDRGSSYRGQRRDSRGRYSRNGNYSSERRMYSRDGAKDRMMEHLEDMMQEAGSEKEREAIRRCMAQMENA